MRKYVFAYYGGLEFSSPEEGAEHRAKWEAWVRYLGDAMVDPVTPMGKSKTVGSGGVSDNGGSDPLTGFSIVKADSMEAALEMAKRSPHLDIGTIKVAEVMEM